MGFIEISDWRNGINFSFYSIDIDELHKQTLLINNFTDFMKNQLKIGRPISCVRFLMTPAQNKTSGEFLKTNGYHKSHYFIYEKTLH